LTLAKTICPVCNGFDALAAACPRCGASAEDYGRLYDYFGPYAPYRPIDDMKMTDGYPDVAEQICLHAAFCARCAATFVAEVSESGTTTALQ